MGIKPGTFIVGKRIPIGAAVGAAAAIALFYFGGDAMPEYVEEAIKLVAIAAAQLLVVNIGGVTTE